MNSILPGSGFLPALQAAGVSAGACVKSFFIISLNVSAD